MRFEHTKTMDAFIKEHYMLPASELAEKFNQAFGTHRNSNQLNAARKARGLSTGRTGRFFKGQPKVVGSGAKGSNGTSFKKGAKPHNQAAIGDEVITTKDGYIKVKIANPGKWKFKHVINWEAVNGKVPAGHVFWFIDQNQKNCDISNLEVISRSEQVRRNQLRVSQYPSEFQETVKLIAKVKHKAGKVAKAES